MVKLTPRAATIIQHVLRPAIYAPRIAKLLLRERSLLEFHVDPLEMPVEVCIIHLGNSCGATIMVQDHVAAIPSALNNLVPNVRLCHI